MEKIDYFRFPARVISAVMWRTQGTTMRIYLAIAVLVIISSSSGCSTVPPATIHAIASVPSSLVVHDHMGYLRVFDLVKNEWSSRIGYPNVVYSSNNSSPSVGYFRAYDDSVVIHCYVNNPSYEGVPNGIYRYSKKNGLVLEHKIERGVLVGVDDKYYYIKGQSQQYNDKTVSCKYRINKMTGEKIDKHFDEYTELTVIDTTKNNDAIYYLAVDIDLLQSVQNYNKIANGSMYLIVSSGSGQKIKKYVLGSVMDIYSGYEKFTTSYDGRTIFEILKRGPGTQLCSLNQGNVECVNRVVATVFYEKYLDSTKPTSNALVWDLDQDNSRNTIERINIETGKRIKIKLPNNMLTTSGVLKYEDNVWIGAAKFEKFVGDRPYLVRVSALDNSTTSYLLTPGFFEAMETVLRYFLRYFNPVTYLGPG